MSMRLFLRTPIVHGKALDWERLKTIRSHTRAHYNTIDDDTNLMTIYIKILRTSDLLFDR